MTPIRSKPLTLKCLVIALVLILCPMAYSKETLVVGWEDFPPQQWMDEQGQLQGLDIAIITAVLKSAGFDIAFKKLPWNRIVNSSIKTGEVDIALNAALNDDRKSYAYYSSIPYLPSDSALYIRQQDRDKFNNIHSLVDIISHKLTIGVTRDMLYSDDYTRLLKNPDFVSKLSISAKEEQAIRMLLAGRVDGIITERYMLNKVLHGINTDIVIVLHSDLGINKEQAGSYFMFSKASVTAEQVKRINQSLEQLKNNGTLHTIIMQHLY